MKHALEGCPLVLVGICRPKIANTDRGSTPASLDSLEIRHIIEHPEFKQAVNAASSSGVTSSSSLASSSGSFGIAPWFPVSQ